MSLEQKNRFKIMKTIQVRARVSYWEDATVNGVEDTNGNLIPCVVDGNWCPSIDIETGIIENWNKGVTADIHYKICDGCGISVYDKKGKDIFTQDDGYVPSILSPKENGYGDYIIMDIDENGKIKDWDNSLIKVKKTKTKVIFK